MNRRYIDFVPTKPAERSGAGAGGVARSSASVGARAGAVSAPGRVARETRVVQKTRVVYRELPQTLEAARVKQTAGASGFSISGDSKLGVIEDLHPKFIKTEVEKRPLSSGRSVEGPVENLVPKSEITEAKAKKIGLRRRFKPVENSVNNPVEKSVEKTVESVRIEQKKQVFQMPKNPFINQDKVVKRPLSKNVYYRTEVPKSDVVQEEPKGTVAIISKPKKDAHVNLIVTIIITIILGAAAGTVAFLLLPK